MLGFEVRATETAAPTVLRTLWGLPRLDKSRLAMTLSRLEGISLNIENKKRAIKASTLLKGFN